MLLAVLALGLSGVSLIVSIVGTALSNKRSSEALKEARTATETALWSGMQDAVQRLVGFDPTVEPVGERLANFRIAGISLVDGLGTWDGLDRWLESERLLGAVLAREVMSRVTQQDSVEQRVEMLLPYQQWAGILSQNLRHFHRTGFDLEALAKLDAAAQDRLRTVAARNGWEIPPRESPEVTPL